MPLIELYAANQATTTVTSGGTGAPSPGTQETWTVASSVMFGAAQTGISQFHVADTATGKTGETIAVTNVSGTTWTVTRGAEGTTPVAHSAGFTIIQVVSAGALSGMLQGANNLSDVASQQAALNTIAGGVTSGRYLRGTGSNVQLAAIQAGDLPAATTSVQGTVQFDNTVSDLQPNGVPALGITGKAPDAGHIHPQQPWQFLPEAYGAKADATLALVTVSNGSAVINTTPLGAPAAPSLANSGSGGTILAGTYQAKITYVNRWGETTASSSASTTTSGSTSTITVTPPNVAGSGDATGWYLYLTQAGGSTYTRQQTVGSPTAMGAPLVLTAPPSSNGAQPPGSDTTAAQVFTSTLVDAGKNIMICGALGTPGGPWIDTITSVQSPTQATLSTASATVNQAGCAMVFASDDRIAIDNCVTAARTYALANNYFAQVVFSKRYGLGTGLFQSAVSNATGALTYNTQVRIPVPNPSGDSQVLEIQFVSAGPADGSYEQFWMSQVPDAGPAALFSFSIGPNSSPDATYGQQSIIGGPSGGAGTGANGYFGTKAVIRGLRVWQPGWSNSIGIDLIAISGCQVRAGSFSFAPGSSLGSGVNPYSGWTSQSFWTSNKIAAGMRLPGSDANQHTLVESFAAGGVNTGLITSGDGAIIEDLITVACDVAVKLPSVGPSAHDLIIQRLYWETCNGGILCISDGSLRMGVNITMDSEIASLAANDVSDTGNTLTGIIRWTDTFRSPAVPTVNGASRVTILNDMIGPGHMASPPSVPLTTVAASPVWRPAWVTVHAGAGVTVSAITVDGTATGLTASAGTSIAVQVPSGKTIALTYSGGTPTWDWWLN